MSATVGTVVIPGDELGSTTEYICGDGTYIRGDSICASRLGAVSVQPSTEAAKDGAPTAVGAASSSRKPVLSVVKPGAKSAGAVVPAVGNLVVGKVTRITPLAASVDILVLDGKPIDEPFNGIIRKEHVRESEIDKVKIDECFRPGDVVYASVASLGDARSYVLSTAKPEFGVIYARSEAGDVMVPISYEEMEAPSTGVREKRKCAKPQL